MLFLLSVLSWTFVLSGLSMEAYEGLKAGATLGADVVGASQATMNNRPTGPFLDTVYRTWPTNTKSEIPLAAAVYVASGSELIMKTSTPNVLPMDASSGIFLAPQAEVPITGHIWGLVVKYNCTPVHRLSQFTILNRRVDSTNPAYVSPETYSDASSDDSSFASVDTDIHYFYTLDDGSSISVLSQLGVNAVNIIGFAEVGLSTGFGNLVESSASWGYNRSCVFCGDSFEKDVSIPTYSGLDEDDVFEMALWQTYFNVPGITGNFTEVQDDIPELENEHTQPKNPFGENDGNAYPWNGNMKAIGVRCTSSSVTGTAKVNGFTGSFSDFERQDPYSDGNIPPNPPRLGLGIPLMFLQTNQDESFLNFGGLNRSAFERLANYSVNYTVVNVGYEWLKPLIVAGGLHLNLSTTAQQFDYYHTLVQASHLQRALTFAYQQYAVQLMFQGSSSIDDKWMNSGVASAVPWTFIRAANPGVPPVFILVTMLLWAFGCTCLAIVYGFRKRCSQTFDDRFLFAFIRDPRNAGLRLDSDFLVAERRADPMTVA